MRRIMKKQKREEVLDKAETEERKNKLLQGIKKNEKEIKNLEILQENLIEDNRPENI